jgi:hypothetical protein
MSNDWQADMSESSRYFCDLVWPVIRAAVGGGDMVPVESVQSTEFTRTLDIVAGIDAWIVQGHHIFGIASRIQYDTSWETFTIRMSRPNNSVVEYQKRRDQIATPGSLFPRWTVQAYVDRSGPKLLAAGAVLTEHVIQAVTDQIGYMQMTYNAEFWVVPWDKLGDKVWRTP